MPKAIDSYNSSFPISYYEIGTVYSFYGRGEGNSQLATDEQIRRFSGVLRELEQREQANAIKPVNGGSKSGMRGTLSRFYAVVVDKIYGSKAKIQVMFLNIDDGRESFLVRSYAVGFGCSTDGKDLMPASASTNISGIQGEQGKVGGITRSSPESQTNKIGGITRVHKEGGNAGGIGGITRKSSAVDIGAETHEVKKVGGITRVRKG